MLLSARGRSATGSAARPGWSWRDRVGIVSPPGSKPRPTHPCHQGSNVPDTITITDDRTGKTVTVPITDGVFPATAVRELDPSLFIYDPAYMQTAACKSAITYLDGDAGILRYRGYPIEQLAEKSTYLEVAYLLLNGELPNAAAAGAVDRRRHAPHVHPREHAQAVRRRLPLRRAPDGHAGQLPRRARHVLQRREGHPRQGQPRQADPAPDREDADAGGDVLPLLGRPAVRVPEQRASASRPTSST